VNVLQRAKAVISKTYFDKYVSDFLSGNDLPGSPGSITQDMALRYSAFFGCARVLAETFASVSINEFKKLEDGDREKTDDTGLLDILKFVPNDEMSAYNFHEAFMYQLNFGGNFVAERLMNGRKIAGLVPLEWQNYNMYRDKDDRKLKFRLHGTTEDVILERKDVLHVPGPSVNGVFGMSVLEYAASAIRLGYTYEQFGQKFYENSATPSGIFKHPGFLKGEAYNRLKKELDSNYQGLANAGRPILAEDGLDFQQLTIKPIDAELLGSKAFQIEDICRFFRVQPHLVQHLAKSTNNNIEHQSLEFAMYTMLPHFKRAEQAINTQLLTARQRKEGYYFEYNMASLLRGDQKSMAEAFAKGIQWGWFSVNDVRRMLNLNKVAGGDTYLQPLNMVPLGTVPDETEPNEAIANKVKDLMNLAGEKD
jgi:HK97 family phage portal protein